MGKQCVIFYPHIVEYGGIERNIIGLANEVKSRGVSPLLLCYYDRIGMCRHDSGLHVVELGDHWNPFVKAYRLRRWLITNQQECIGIPFFFGAKAGFYGALFADLPYTLHYTDPPSLLSPRKAQPKALRYLLTPKRAASQWLIARGVRRAYRVLTMTQQNAAELQALYGRTFEVLYQGGVPPSDVRDFPRCSDTTLRLFSICRLTESKNLTWILDATLCLMSKSPYTTWFKRIEVTIAGTGPEEIKLRRYANRLGLGTVAQFPGFLSGQQVEVEFSQADLFLVPGRQGYGLPVLEALYRRVPVVLNRASRISETLKENPWAGISEDSSEAFSQTVESHIRSLRNEYPHPQCLSSLPTEDAWARELGKRCDWWF